MVCAHKDYLAKHGIPNTPDDLTYHQCLTYRFFGSSLWEFSLGDERYSVPVGGNLSANESVVLLQSHFAKVPESPYNLTARQNPILNGVS